MMIKLEELDSHHTIKSNFGALQSQKYSSDESASIHTDATKVAGSLLLIVYASGLGNLKFWIASIQFQPQQMPTPLWNGSGPR